MTSHTASATQSSRSHVLRRLIEIQGEQSDAAMAQWLGIERSYWCRMRNGSLPLSFATIIRAIAKDETLLTYHMRDLMPGDAA